ncbi:hypothetical protein [uncultured Agrococcus sp.]|uniref:hypothetical protein n=1 Tax=uncultured Agrococcus sp. TaxID=382258 RepID=UPI0025D1C765|nr:hypothetical protein [uncultured Agrococcus sp.]
MKITKRSKAVLAGAMALGLGFVAAPAMAQEEASAPSFEIENDTFTAGSWGEGIAFSVTLPEDLEVEVDRVVVSVGSMGQNGGGLVGDADAELQPDDTYASVVLPEGAGPVAPDADGYPEYSASAGYVYTEDGEDVWVWADNVSLTILEGATVDGPSEVTAAELAAGIDLELTGFASNAEVTGEIFHFNPETGEYESIGDVETLTLDENGAGIVEITISYDDGSLVPVDSQFRVDLAGADSTVSHWLTVVEGDDDDDSSDDPDQPTPPDSVDTGR